MPGKESTSSRELKRTAQSKELSGWMARRLTGRVLPVTSPSSIGLALSRFISDREGHQFGTGNTLLVRRAVDHTALALATWPKVSLASETGVADSIQRRLTSMSTAWRPVQPLAWVQPRGSQSAISHPAAHDSRDSQAAGDSDLLTRHVQLLRTFRTSPVSSVEKVADDAPRISRSPSEHLTRPMTASRHEPYPMKGEPSNHVDTPVSVTAVPVRGSTAELLVHRPNADVTRPPPLTRGDRIDSATHNTFPVITRNPLSPSASAERVAISKMGEPSYPRTPSGPHKSGSIVAQQVTGRRGRFTSHDVSLGRMPHAAGVHFDEAPKAETWERETSEQGGAGLSRRDQHSSRTQGPSPILTPTTRLMPPQQRLRRIHEDTPRKSINQDHTSLIQPLYYPSSVQPQGGARGVADEPTSAPLAKGIAGIPASKEPAAHSSATVSSADGVRQPAARESQTSPYILHGFSENSLAKHISGKFDRSPEYRRTEGRDEAASRISSLSEAIDERLTRVSLSRATPEPGAVRMDTALTDRSTGRGAETEGTPHTPLRAGAPRPPPRATESVMDMDSESSSDSLAYHDVTAARKSEALLYRVSQFPSIGSGADISVEGAVQGADPRYATTLAASSAQGWERLNLDTDGRRGTLTPRRPGEGYHESIWSGKHALSFPRDLVKPLPIIRGISRSASIPTRESFRKGAGEPLAERSEAYEFLQGGDSLRSSPDYGDARQRTPILGVTAEQRPRADCGVVAGERVFRRASDSVLGSRHSGNHDMPALALASVAGMTETQTVARVATPEPRVEKGEEEPRGPDIRALAREVYPLIRRMIMIERDRQPTWK